MPESSQGAAPGQSLPHHIDRGRVGPAARILRPWSREMAIPHGTRLADRPCRRLFRFYADVLPRLAATAHNRGSPHSHRVSAGGLASSYAGSVLRFSRCTLQRRWDSGGGSFCSSFHPSSEATKWVGAFDAAASYLRAAPAISELRVCGGDGLSPRSCPWECCSSRCGTAIAGIGRTGQPAIAVRLTADRPNRRVPLSGRPAAVRHC
jgi:hypothetical protein